MKEYAHIWEELGYQLKFHESEIKVIHKNHPNDAEECCKDLLHRWLRKQANATWDQLLLAIDNLPTTSINEKGKNKHIS